MFTQGLSYSAIHTARSSISTLMELNGRPPVGKTSGLITRFMKSVFNARPSLPRYKCTWEPVKLLTSIATVSDDSFSSITYNVFHFWH